MTPKAGRPLTAKQAAFCDEYLVDFNATQAAIRAGYSTRTADRIGPELLGKTWVRAAIAERQAERAQNTRITAAEVVRMLVREANYMGEGSSHGARVAALGLLAKHVGLLERRMGTEETQRGVILIPVPESELPAARAALARRKLGNGRG